MQIENALRAWFMKGRLLRTSAKALSSISKDWWMSVYFYVESNNKVLKIIFTFDDSSF